MNLVLLVKLILSESVAAQFVPAGAARPGVMYRRDRIIKWSASGSYPGASIDSELLRLRHSE
jgi:hypothetical protein